MRITVHNRGPEAAAAARAAAALVSQHLVVGSTAADAAATASRWRRSRRSPQHSKLGTYHLYAAPAERRSDIAVLFTENETNTPRLYGRAQCAATSRTPSTTTSSTANEAAVNPRATGTKAAAHYHARQFPPAASRVQCGCGSAQCADSASRSPTSTRSSTQHACARRTSSTQPCSTTSTTPTHALVQRQAFAGMIWSKQFFYYDIPQWLNGDPTQAAAARQRASAAATASGRI